MLKTVTISSRENHEGHYASTITVEWVCLKCGSPRGETYSGFSYDGSRRMAVDCWDNPCGHLELYSDVLAEAEKGVEE